MLLEKNKIRGLTFQDPSKGPVTATGKCKIENKLHDLVVTFNPSVLSAEFLRSHCGDYEARCFMVEFEALHVSPRDRGYRATIDGSYESGITLSPVFRHGQLKDSNGLIKKKSKIVEVPTKVINFVALSEYVLSVRFIEDFLEARLPNEGQPFLRQYYAEEEEFVAKLASYAAGKSGLVDRPLLPSITWGPGRMQLVSDQLAQGIKLLIGTEEYD